MSDEQRDTTQQGERTFTQADVDRIVAERLSRSKGTMEAYRAQMEQEAAAQAEAQAMRERFENALGNDREPVHPRMTEIMLEDFRTAVNDPANAGRSDTDIFSSLFGDGTYVKPKGATWHPNTGKLPRPGTHVQSDKLREAFGLTPRKD